MRLLRSAPANSILLLLLALASWPVSSIRPASGLDESWIAGLHLAADQGLRFGSEIVFTYGPLGFLTVPRLYFAWTALLGLLLALLVGGTLAFLLMRALRPKLGTPLAIVATYIMLALFAGASLLGDQTIFTIGLIGLAAIESGARCKYPMAVAPVLGGLFTAAILIKFSAIVLFPIGALAAAGLSPHRRRALQAFSAGAIGTFAIVWGAAGGVSPSAAISWLLDSLSIASGFEGALYTDMPQLRWEFLPAATTLILLVVAAFSRTARLPTKRRAAVLLGTALVLWFLTKQGFVRHDQHSFSFFSGMVLLAIATISNRRSASIALVVVAISGTSALATAQLDGFALLQPTSRLEKAVGQFTDVLVPSRRHRIQSAARATIETAIPIEPNILRLIGHAPVHVLPSEISAVWAYRLNWKPTPIFQEYVAYTDRLSRRNGDFLLSDSAPDFLLIHPSSPNTEFATWSPRAAFAIYCRYRADAVGAFVRLLRRGTDRCGPEEGVTTIRVRPGVPFRVPPRLGTSDLVIARFGLPGKGIRERIRSVIYRSSEPPRALSFDNREYSRLVESTAASSNVVRGPSDPTAPILLYPSVDVERLVVLGGTRPVTVRFSRVRLRG